MLTISPLLAAGQTGSLAANFTWIDWLVVFAYLALTTLIGAKMAGKQATIRDFFLGGRKLPWLAVCGSNIATEISAVTFVAVPATVFAPEGNATYLQLGLIGSVLARIIVGYVFVPAYYKREIYSPYDYMANQLGGNVRTLTTCLFILGGALAQGSRVFLTALILDLIIGQPVFGTLSEATGISTLTWSIYLIGVIAVGWTWIGGITTVIWTDVILFLVFLFGAAVALAAVVFKLPGGWSELWAMGMGANEAGSWGKFTFIDLDRSPIKQYTIWTAAIASTWGGLFSYGTDQMMVQRVFCCKGPREARRAVIFSTVGQIVTVIVLLVGVGLYAFYSRFPERLTGEAAALVAEKTDRIFPVFIIQELPTGISGLVIAGIFAAAISTLVSVVAAFSQTTISAFYLPVVNRRRAAQGIDANDPAETARHERGLVSLSRVLVVVWGLILCLTAQLSEAAQSQFPQILDLALSMAGYTGGALLAGFMLAFLRLNVDGRGLLWSAPLSVLLVFGLVWHEDWARVVCWLGAGAILATWLWCLPAEARRQGRSGLLPRNGLFQTAVLMAGLALTLAVSYWGYFDVKRDPGTGEITKYITLAWPWFIPIGSTVAFVWGYLLARERVREADGSELFEQRMIPAGQTES